MNRDRLAPSRYSAVGRQISSDIGGEYPLAAMRSVTNGVGIEFDVTGSGRPVVLLHGFPDSGRLWRNQVPALAGAGFQVIVPDLRGYGRSDKPGTAVSYSFPSLIGDVMAVLSDAVAELALVAGYDVGASLVCVFASHVP